MGINPITMKALARDVTPPLLWRAAARLIKPPHANEMPPSVRNRDLFEEHIRLNKGCPPDRIVIRDGLSLRLHPESRMPFEHFCYRDRDMVEELDCFLEQTVGRKRLLDVGALHGFFSLVFTSGDPSRSALAVDPSPIAFARLLYNLHANERESRVACVECALSDAEGVLRMHYEWEHAIAVNTRNDDDAALCVPKTRGDILCAAKSFEPDVVKIDVEGHEGFVITGLLPVIEQLRPLIFIEVHPELIRAAGYDPSDIFNTLTRLGYEILDTDGHKLSAEAYKSKTVIHRVMCRSAKSLRAR
jgi:FkbM family methyltransferase